MLKGHDLKIIYPVFHFTCIRNRQKHGRGRSQFFPMELDDKIFYVGLLAQKAKYNQVFRLIGDKKCFKNIPIPHRYSKPVSSTWILETCIFHTGIGNLYISHGYSKPVSSARILETCIFHADIGNLHLRHGY